MSHPLRKRAARGLAARQDEAPEAPAQQTADDPPPGPPPETAPARPRREAASKKRKAWIPEPVAPQLFLGRVAPGPGWRR